MKINLMYFSPTRTTKKIVKTFGEALAKEKGFSEIEEFDFTLKKYREKKYSFSDKDIVVLGIPVYAGRVPNVLKEFISTIKGNGALAVAFTVFGNRSFDDALVELRDIMKEDGFKVIAAGGFVGEHAFSKILGKDRPQSDDLGEIEEFALEVAKKIESGLLKEDFFVEGEVPYRPYYTPRNMEGEPVKILKVKPKTTEDCIDCKLCVQLCPMESISYEDPSQVTGICIKCGACIKFCPVSAKYYDDEGFLGHKEQIETTFIEPKENQRFL